MSALPSSLNFRLNVLLYWLHLLMSLIHTDYPSIVRYRRCWVLTDGPALQRRSLYLLSPVLFHFVDKL